MSTYEVLLVIASMASGAGAIAAAAITFFSARSSVRQVRLQREQYEASMQPYVWADVRPRDEDGQLLQLVVGNSGPTVATNIRVTVDPDIPHAPRHDKLLDEALERFNKGHASIPPGRIHAWSLGTGVEVLHDPTVDRRMTVTIEGQGPHGPLPPLSYPIDLNDWRGTSVQANGSLYRIEKVVESQGKALANVIAKIASR